MRHWYVKAGFTLVELAVALAVLALLVAGVLTGRELLRGGEEAVVMADMQSYTGAVAAFEKTYGALPGDMANPGAYFSGLSATDVGDGDGTIETSNAFGYDETLAFWAHLKAAGLLTTEQARLDAGIGLPQGAAEESVYQVEQDPSLGLALRYSVLRGGVAGYAVLRPEDALALDQKYDDGNPSAGRVRAEDGADTPLGCVNGGAYDTANPDPACQLRIVVEAARTGISVAGSSVACGYVGEARATGALCDTGYIGEVLETCMKDGSWNLSHHDCEIVRCGHGGVYGETKDFLCPPGLSGTTTRTCREGGVWGSSVYNCTPVVEGQPCTPNGTTQTVACPPGQQGAVYYHCSGGVWVRDAAGSCTNILCGAGEIGAVQASSCPSGFTGQLLESCTLAGQFFLGVSNCYIDRGETCATAGATRTVTCPTGQVGAITQYCKDTGTGTNWVTTQYGCDQVRCGDEPVGTFRPTQAPCGAGETGVIYEVCNESGTWEAMDGNCTKIRCSPAAGGTDGFATWPWADANDAVQVSGTCLPGYGASVPRRVCQSNGQWSAVVAGTECKKLCQDGGNWYAPGQSVACSATGCSCGSSAGTKTCQPGGTWGACSSTCNTCAPTCSGCVPDWCDSSGQWRNCTLGCNPDGSCMCGPATGPCGCPGTSPSHGATGC